MKYVQCVLVAAFFLLGGCSSGETEGGEGTTAAGQQDLRIVFVTHGQAADPFWSVVQNGMRDAAQEVGVEVEYQAPRSYDMVVMGRLIDATVASDPDGMVVSVSDPDALRTPIQKAVKAGIPVISVNSGYEAAQKMGVLAHVGQTEYEAGYEGGKEMAAAGVEKALCVNHSIGNVSLDRRCEGFSDAFEEAGGTTELLATEVGDPNEAQQRIQARLSSDATIDGLITLGPSMTQPALRALQETETQDRVTMATFDLSPRILEGIEDGDILFAIDQQPYLQGYLPVTMMALRLRNNASFPDEVVRTGPAFVTDENVAELRDLTEKGLR